jgi:hypothetical protein
MDENAPKGVHSWLVFFKAMHAISKLIQADLQRTELGESRLLEERARVAPGSDPESASSSA